jgi:uncharacterized protein (TIGR02246 family)
MRPILVALIALLTLSTGPSVQAGSKEDAFAAVEQWVAAFNAHDVEKVVATFAPDALVLGTLSPTLATTPDDLRKYFGASAAAKSEVRLGESSAIVLSDNAVEFIGFYEFSRPKDGQTVTTPARFTILATKRDGVWKIGHLHSSARPKPPQ